MISLIAVPKGKNPLNRGVIIAENAVCAIGSDFAPIDVTDPAAFDPFIEKFTEKGPGFKYAVTILTMLKTQVADGKAMFGHVLAQGFTYYLAEIPTIVHLTHTAELEEEVAERFSPGLH